MVDQCLIITDISCFIRAVADVGNVFVAESLLPGTFLVSQRRTDPAQLSARAVADVGNVFVAEPDKMFDG